MSITALECVRVRQFRSGMATNRIRNLKPSFRFSVELATQRRLESVWVYIYMYWLGRALQRGAVCSEVWCKAVCARVFALIFQWYSSLVLDFVSRFDLHHYRAGTFLVRKSSWHNDIDPDGRPCRTAARHIPTLFTWSWTTKRSFASALIWPPLDALNDNTSHPYSI